MNHEVVPMGKISLNYSKSQLGKEEKLRIGGTRYFRRWSQIQSDLEPAKVELVYSASGRLRSPRERSK